MIRHLLTATCAAAAWMATAAAQDPEALAPVVDAEPLPAAAEAVDAASPIADAPASPLEPVEPAPLILEPRLLAGADAEEAIAAANAYLNNLDQLRGRFLQLAYDGSIAQGAFYLDRPGKARFEYDPPTPFLIVSDGRTVAHRDEELGTVDRVPLRATPLHLFLKPRIDLASDVDIESVQRIDGSLVISARDPDGEMEGRVDLVFAGPALELREWIVTDAFDQPVRVILSQIEHGGDFEPALFVLRDERRGRGPRR